MFFGKAVTTEHILKAHNCAEYEHCRWCFSRNFPKIFRTAILKKTFWGMFHISLKKTSGWVLLMWQHSKNILVEVNLPHSWPWKQNGITVVAAVMILKVVNNWRIMLQINILKKVRLWTLITVCYTGMLPLQYLSDWCVRGIYIWQKFGVKNISNWVIIWIKFKVLWLL